MQSALLMVWVCDIKIPYMKVERNEFCVFCVKCDEAWQSVRDITDHLINCHKKWKGRWYNGQQTCAFILRNILKRVDLNDSHLGQDCVAFMSQPYWIKFEVEVELRLRLRLRFNWRSAEVELVLSCFEVDWRAKMIFHRVRLVLWFKYIFFYVSLNSNWLV